MNPITRSVLALSFAACFGCLAGCAGTPAANDQKTAAPKGMYAFWPKFPEEPHVQFLGSYGSSEDVEPTKTSGLERLVFGKNVAKEAAIVKPYGVAMRDGRIYVADMRGKALAIFDLKKKQTRLVGITGVNVLEHPVAVAVADDGMIYVADNIRGTVFVFDSSERFSRFIGFEKFKPVALAVHGDRLYAADIAGQNVVVFDRRDGKKLGTIGTVGDEDGQFRVPIGVSTDKAGNLYVMDAMRCRLQKFSPEGKFISGVGTLGDTPGTFARPKHIAVDADGIVYAVDAAFQNVQMFDDQDRLLMEFGANGAFPGAMDLPAGIAVCEGGAELFTDKLHPGFSAKRLIVVTNQFGPNKVSVYALGDRREGYSAQAMAAQAIELPTGMRVPTAEQLKMQNPGGEEPPPEAGAPGAEPAKPDAPKPDAPKPDAPKPDAPKPVEPR